MALDCVNGAGYLWGVTNVGLACQAIVAQFVRQGMHGIAASEQRNPFPGCDDAPYHCQADPSGRPGNQPNPLIVHLRLQPR